MSDRRCTQRWMVDAILDGRVGGPERAAFERHLATCHECDKLSRQALTARAALKELSSGVPDAVALRRQRWELMRKFDGVLTKQRPNTRQRAFVLALALLAAASTALWLWPRAAPHSRASWVDIDAPAGASWSEQLSHDLDRVTMKDGRFRLRIRRPSPDSRVQLVVPDGQIEDLGTSLEVWLEGARTQHVAVAQGRVILRLDGLPEIRLQTGEQWDRAAPAAPSRSLDAGSNLPALGAAQTPVGPKRPKRRRPSESPSKLPNLLEPPPHSALAQRSSPADTAEDAEYVRILDLLESDRPKEAHAAVLEYLARYPHGFRRLEAREVQQRLEGAQLR